MQCMINATGKSQYESATSFACLGFHKLDIIPIENTLSLFFISKVFPVLIKAQGNARIGTVNIY